MSKFVSLHNYTHFSILESLISPKELLTRAKELGQSAVAITDHGSMAGVWDAYKAAKELKIKLIVGCEFYFVNSVENKDEKLRFVILLAKNLTGYRNLLMLNKEGFENASIISKKVFPTIDWNILKKYSDGLICLTGCGNGIVSQLINNKKFEEAENTLKQLAEIFGDNLGVEVQAHNLNMRATQYSDSVNQIFVNGHIIRLAQKLNIRIVPTIGSRYLKKEQFDIHDALLAVGAMQPIYSNARIKYDVSDLYLKSDEEIISFFSRNHSKEFAEKICENTLYFANMCEEPNWVDPKFTNPSGKELPVFPIEDEVDYNDFCQWLTKQPEKIKELDKDKSYLRYKCLLALPKLGLIGNEEYEKRLEEELDTLYYCGVSSYMLIVADYVNWAKKNNVPAGPGRGSVGGSLVAYLLGIHMADPIKYGLVFPRFHNKLKKSYSDIDCDFSKDKRETVISYLNSKYGKDKLAQITNFIFITPKVYVRDICRSYDLAGGRSASVKLGTDIADIIPKIVDGREVRTYRDIIERSPLFSEYIKKYIQLEKCAPICGKPRALGLHAAGVIISNRPISSIAPTRIDKDNILSIQLDKDRVEEIGLVKMDILGLETLDIIEQTNILINKNKKTIPNIKYDEYDKKTYDLISNGNTFGVFQFGNSAGTIDLCKKIKPKDIEDLAIITTLARPASKDIREDFIKVKAGKERIKLAHPILGNALNNTFGFPLYDESLLVLAKDVAGWDLAEADKLRKLTKEKGKNPEKVEKWRQEFIEGAVKNNVPKNVAADIWHNIIEPFGKYSFNKSHAVFYSMISFHTAYLKAHFPVEFLLANLMYEIKSNAKDAKKKIERIKQELRNNGIKIVPPDINKSGMTYQIQEDGSLLTGFEALKNVGDDAIKDLIAKRPFVNFDDFMLRSDTSKIRSTTIQSLAASGCLDSFGIPRKMIYLYCSDYKKKIQVWLKKHDPAKEKFEFPWPVDKEWGVPELYALEKVCIGEAFICGKKEAYGSFFTKDSTPLKYVKQMKNNTPVSSIRAEVKDIFEFKIKKQGSKLLGKDMAKVNIEDESGEQMSLTIFPDMLEEVKRKIKDLSRGKLKLDDGVGIHFSGKVNHYDDDVGIILESIYNFCPPPAIPKNLKPQKTILENRELNKKLEKLDISEDVDEYLSGIEDSLYNEGLIDFEEEGSEASAN